MLRAQAMDPLWFCNGVVECLDGMPAVGCVLPSQTWAWSIITRNVGWGISGGGGMFKKKIWHPAVHGWPRTTAPSTCPLG